MATFDRAAGDLIRQLRSSSGMSQAELARRAGLTRSVMNAYERGNRQPGVDALARIVAAAGMELMVAPRVQAVDPVRAGRLLEQVLDLAEALPFRRRRELKYPGLPRAA
ncbi:MAG TPA: helix-turn-helix transcriptional regulator [Solirubrobacterales bacterium]|jgi:transcriptional regulator with XRE-family HTH domain|nr:helix-turn-helix transcriptional regulator [Solirubrobacterales bacterium]